MDKSFHIIYKTTCLLNDKFYIGMHSTNKLNDNYFGSGVHLLRSLQKHGKKNHKYEILFYYKNRTDLIQKEQELVNEELLNNPLCMNMTCGGGGPRNAYRSTEEKLKKHRSNSELRKGIPLSEEHKRKVSEGNKGKFVSEETRRKQSDVYKVRSNEQAEMIKQKQSIAKLGNKCRPTRCISIDGVEYSGMAEASKILNISLGVIWHRIKSKSDKFKEYLYIE